MRTTDGLAVARGPRAEMLCLVVALLPVLVLFACSRPRVVEFERHTITVVDGETLDGLSRVYAAGLNSADWQARVRALNPDMPARSRLLKGQQLVVVRWRDGRRG